MISEFNKYPVDQFLDRIATSIASNPVTLVKAEPGAGKTTRIPPYLIDKVPGKTLVLEPRRLAARLSAERSSWFLGEKCGERIGYQIRQDSKKSDKTKCLFITEGLFVRLLHQSNNLDGVDLIVLDEFHERNIYTDIALTIIRKLQSTTRPDLKLLIMSATLDSRSLEDFVGGATVFDIPGRVFPVSVEYLPPLSQKTLSVKGLEEDVIQATQRMLSDDRCTGNILIFLTGLGEIMSLHRRMEDEISDVEVVPLSAGVSKKDQARAFSESGGRKIIISTNVAETSLTLPNITGVVDLGLAKIAGVAPWSGMPTLEVKRISQASAVQRAGRAGRTSEGVVYRIYSKADFTTREQFSSPDVDRLEFSHVLLDLLALGHSVNSLDWLTLPNPDALKKATELLNLIGALDGDELTDHGREISSIPLHPRLGRFIMAGKDEGIMSDAILGACIISEGFVVRGETSEDEYSCDLSYQIDLVKSYLSDKRSDARYLLDRFKVERVVSLYKSLARSLRCEGQIISSPCNSKIISSALLKSFPDRVAVKRKLEGKKNRSVFYNFCTGRGGQLAFSSVLTANHPDFFIALEATENLKGNAAKGIQVRYASKVELSALKDDPAGLTRNEVVSEFNEKKGELKLSYEVYYGKIRIEVQKGGVVSGDSDIPLAELLKECWPYPFGDANELDEYHARVKVLNDSGVENDCPLFEGEMLELFFEAISDEVRSLKELEKRSLSSLIYEQLSFIDQQILNNEAPKLLKLSNGKSIKVCYKDDGPVAEALVQDFYGVAEAPSVAGGKLAIKLIMLGPNRRPAQITNDLYDFWKGSYSEVSKELRRRYPKHYWPDRPELARPLLLKRLAES